MVVGTGDNTVMGQIAGLTGGSNMATEAPIQVRLRYRGEGQALLLGQGAGPTMEVRGWPYYRGQGLALPVLLNYCCEGAGRTTDVYYRYHR